MSWVAIAVGAGIGAASGGIMSAVNHQPIWKGMLIGAATGAAGGGLGAGLGALGGAASGSAGGAASGSAGGAAGGAGGGAAGGAGGGAAGGAGGGGLGAALGDIGTAATPVATGGSSGAVGGTGGGAAGAVSGGGGSAAVNPTVQAALTQSPTAITSQGIGTAANAPTIGIGGAAPVSSAPVTSSAESGLTSMIDKAMPALKGTLPGTVLDMAKGTMGGTTFTGDASKEQQAKEAQGAEWAQDTYSSGSWLPGKAKGGAIHLQDGAFIVPADVVSAIGNGSTKAGAKYLDHLFTAISAGPAPKAGSLAKQRAKQRHAT